jgi:hypothetical protein
LWNVTALAKSEGFFIAAVVAPFGGDVAPATKKRRFSYFMICDAIEQSGSACDTL